MTLVFSLKMEFDPASQRLVARFAYRMACRDLASNSLPSSRLGADAALPHPPACFFYDVPAERSSGEQKQSGALGELLAVQ